MEETPGTAAARPHHKDIDKETLGREMLRAAHRDPFTIYREFTVGTSGWGSLARYEVITSMLGGIPGALGFVLRKAFYPMLLRRAGRGVVIGRNVTLRHPQKIALGDGATVDDYSLLDARGAGREGIDLAQGVIVNRNCLVQAKSGPIRVGPRTTLGSNCVVVSMSGIEIGDSVMIAGGVYVSAGAYRMTDKQSAFMDQGAYSSGPIRIGDNVWIGTGAIILDGVRIGRNAVVGAGAVVTKDVPDHTVVTGVPARVIRQLD